MQNNKKVLFFVTGGSSIAVGVEVAKFLQGKQCQNLTIMLTDERYGPRDHFNSNFFQLIEKGFDVPIGKRKFDKEPIGTEFLINKN